MRNFLKISEGLDIGPLRLQLAARGELWNQFPVRTSHPRSAHRVVDDIVLRYNQFNTGDDYLDKVCANVSVVDYPAWSELTQAHPIIFALMARVGGVHLGRVMVTRLAPGIEIPLHSDRIAEAEDAFPDRTPSALYYERYHVVLASAPGVQFEAGDEAVYMAPGEVWWFDNCVQHRVVNGSAEDRLHLICDIRVRHDHYVPT